MLRQYLEQQLDGLIVLNGLAKTVGVLVSAAPAGPAEVGPASAVHDTSNSEPNRRKNQSDENFIVFTSKRHFRVQKL